jgi:hypothetical protein
MEARAPRIVLCRVTAYRNHEPRSVDLETDALGDLLVRVQKLRRRSALPVLVGGAVAAWLGTTLHCLGYWSVLGELPDGGYYVGAPTILLGAAISGAPVVVPGVLIYVLLRARMRHAWKEDHRRRGVDDAWLEENSRRFG